MTGRLVGHTMRMTATPDPAEKPTEGVAGDQAAAIQMRPLRHLSDAEQAEGDADFDEVFAAHLEPHERGAADPRSTRIESANRPGP